MPKIRPESSGYARLAQAEEEELLGSNSEDEEARDGQAALSYSPTRYAPIQPRRYERIQPPRAQSPPSSITALRRSRSNSGVDLTAINARFERWAEEIAAKFRIRRIKGKTNEEESLEIQHSVFQAPEWINPAASNVVAAQQTKDRISSAHFNELVDNVKTAISQGIHPKLISKGSSGSYFAVNTNGKIVGVFKPKDEEPYASRNPKWTKWVHRNLFPFFFGRACLIPNLSYVSEAAAYVLDTRLGTNIVPYTDIVSLSSKSFHYDFWDRRAYYRKKRPLPEKIGSFQCFLKGYQDATMFLKEHPWPDQRSTRSSANGGLPRRRHGWTDECRIGTSASEDTDDDLDGQDEDGGSSRGGSLLGAEGSSARFLWTDALQQSFREQLEKLVVLDYIMRNTDRGLDNWMVRIDIATQQASIVAKPPKDMVSREASRSRTLDAYQRREQMVASSGATTPSPKQPSLSLGAIDNSLSWPWKHPDAWRSYPFGWLFLSVDLIGQPFTDATRKHFLPLLTSTQWWSETQTALRNCFSQDADFKERMFARQIAVMKGQAWNVVETLKTPDHGPLELTRRARVYVWDDLVEVPVTVPLRSSPSDLRQGYEQQLAGSRPEQEESDISTAHANLQFSKSEPNNVLNPLTLSNGNRFNLSRQSSSINSHGSEDSHSHALLQTNTMSMNGVSRPYHKPRMSYDGSKRSHIIKPDDNRRRRFSFSTRSGPEGDDLEGDIGYSAAENRENRCKKVIMERLETVKGKTPFFTWC